MSSTLAPTPSFNPNIPILGPRGGKKDSYIDPNSPESILKKITTLQVQAAVDTKYDVARSPYYEETESFTNPSSFPDVIRILLVFIIAIFCMLVVYKTFKFSAKLFLLSIAVLLMILVIHIYVRNTDGSRTSA